MRKKIAMAAMPIMAMPPITPPTIGQGSLPAATSLANSSSHRLRHVHDDDVDVVVSPLVALVADRSDGASRRVPMPADA
jgi:hypothetical protein